MNDTAALAAALTQQDAPARQRVTEAEKSLATARAIVNRLHVASLIADADLPAGATVDVVEWADEPNGDGTYDMDLGEAVDADGESLGDLGGSGAVAAGTYDGSGPRLASPRSDGSTGTDWDIFVSDEPAETGETRPLDVNKVYEWIRNEGWNK